ncbi:MAG: peroxiredoxin-like family protein [Chloroflexota bacterium]|nr:MAG: alkyl hydroperoxide reductase [Chloroflexota bacterium]
MSTPSPTSPPTLNGALDEINRATPDEVRRVLDRGIDEVRDSGVAPGLQIGDHAPDFALPNQLGQDVALAGRLAQGPVVLVFYRGDWCPFCNLTLVHLQRNIEAIEAAGASLIAISPQAPDRSLTLAERHGLRFSVLSDTSQETIRAYRLHYTLASSNQELYLNAFAIDLRQQNADGTWDLPAAGTFILDRGGIIRARFVNTDYRTRMEPAAILNALDGLSIEGSLG